MWNFIMMFNLVLADIDPSKNLFSSTWTEGNLYKISWLTSKLGSFACTVISIVGFGIVIFSILKNALSGLYVVNPPFWDHVDEVKKKTANNIAKFDGKGIIDNQKANMAVAKVSGIAAFLLNAIPNVKSFTDFGDKDENGNDIDPSTIDKTQYFTKSLILLIGQIFIGMLIFFGYPAKIANWIGSGATYAVEALLNNYDPITTVAKVSDKFTKVTLQTDNSLEYSDQVINTMTLDAVKYVNTRYTDIKKDSVQNVATEIEAKLLSEFVKSEQVSSVISDNTNFSITVNTSVVTTTPTAPQAYQVLDNSGVYFAKSSSSGLMNFKYWIPVSSLPTGSLKVGGMDYIVWNVTATPQSVSTQSGSDAIMLGYVGKAVEVTSGSNSSAKLGITNINIGKNYLNGIPGSAVTCEYVDKDGTVVGTFVASLQTNAVTNGSSSSSVYLYMSAPVGDGVKKVLESKKIVVAGETKDVAYIRVPLTGNWTYKLHSADGKKTSTVVVSELRLGIEEKECNGILFRGWSDVNATTYKNGAPIGDSVDTYKYLTHTTINN